MVTELIANLRPGHVEDNPPLSELRKRALKVGGAKKTKSGSIALFPKVKSRLEDKTEIIWGKPNSEQKREIESAFELMRNRPMIQMDRLLGQNALCSCRLYISAEYPQVALMWASMLKKSPLVVPNFITISIPEFPRAHVYIFPDELQPIEILLGVDYGGEHKMSFLKQYLYKSKEAGRGLGMHAATTSFFVRDADGKIMQKNAAFLAESGTGKSTLSSHSYGLRLPEKVIFRQDDIVNWSMSGSAYGTEQKCFYVIVANLKRGQQPNIWKATRSRHAIFENVMIKQNGTPDFTDLSLSKNPRAAIRIEDIENASTDIDVPRLDFIFIINRQLDIMPPIMRLSPERAAYEFMAGRTLQTAAADPASIGKPKRTVGLNPFIMGKGARENALAHEGNLFLELLRKNPQVQAFVVNTGSVGGKKDGGEGDIKIKDSATIIREVVKDRVSWRKSELFGEGYEELDRIQDVDMKRFYPNRYYSASQIASLRGAMKKDDLEWMEQFRGELDPSITALLD